MSLVTDQASLFESPAPPAHRVDTLAGVLAGCFRWPDRGSFDKLKKNQQAAAREAATLALERLAREED